MTTPPLSEPPLTAALNAARGPRYDIINLRCRSAKCEDVASVYRMSGGCSNCGTDHLVGMFTSGHEAKGRADRCPACGCDAVRWRQLADLDPETAL